MDTGVDAFGAILPTVPQSCADVPERDLAGGMATWAAFDSPWTPLVDGERFRAAVDALTQLRPASILSSHLPAASGLSIDQSIRVIESVPPGEPFVPPDQEAFDAIVAGLGRVLAPRHDPR